MCKKTVVIEVSSEKFRELENVGRIIISEIGTNYGKVYYVEESDEERKEL